MGGGGDGGKGRMTIGVFQVVTAQATQCNPSTFRVYFEHWRVSDGDGPGHPHVL